MTNKTDKFKHYPKTDLFEITDTIGVPHLFCVKPCHIAHASDHFLGRLGDAAIKDYEDKHGGKSSCGMKDCNLTFDEHKTALIVSVKSKKSLKDLKKELKPFLLKCKSLCEKDKYAGFAFIQTQEDDP